MRHRERDQVRELLQFLESLTVVVFFLRVVDPDDLAQLELGSIEAFERLAETEIATRESWLLLARTVRHLLLVLEARDDPRAVLLQELHRDVLAHADDSAAVGRQNGE